MSEKLKRSKRMLFGSGHAGLASNFMDLAHVKLKHGGVLALVLPFSFTSGASWKRARAALHEHYDRIRVIGIASSGQYSRAFSADTGMAECLVVATKNGGGRTQFTSLPARPRTLLEASECAHRIWAGHKFKEQILDAGGVGVLHKEVVRAAKALQTGELLLPRETQVRAVPIVPLGEIAERGLVHREIVNERQGAFTRRDIRAGEVPTYPMLWSHSAHKERQFEVQPDSCGDVRPGREARANEIWAKASRLHSNLDFQLNSQSLAMCLTPRSCIGGTAWPNVIPLDEKHSRAVLLWANSTLGLMTFWYQGSRQQQGRARLTISRLPELRTIDARKLTIGQLAACDNIYNEFKMRSFLPANEAYRDNVRKDLDRALIRMLSMDESLLQELDLLRLQWCAEPSVHGGKSTRPAV